MSLGRVFLAAALLAFGQQRSFAACTDSAAVAATRAAADQACTSKGMGCSTAKSHGEYVSCVAHQAKAAVKAGTLPKQCKGTVVKCAAKSTCGKPGFVTCCRTTKQGNPACAITPRAARCTAPKHGAACVGSVPSCCDVCAEGACCVRFAAWIAPRPRNTRCRLVASLGRAGLVTRRVPPKGFRAMCYIPLPPSPGFAWRKLTKDHGLTPESVFDRLAHLARRAGIARFSPHDMLRSFIFDLLDAGRVDHA